MNHEYVQFGCGWSAPEGWLNFDSSPTLRFERLLLVGRLYTRNRQRFPAAVRIGDVVQGLPISPESCKGVFCSHVLEHLALEDFRTALRHINSYLRQDGIFRFVLPDLERLARDYLASNDPGASLRFMEDSMLGKKTRSRGIRGTLMTALGNSAHLWMWDERSMARELQEHGFREIRRAQFGDSADPKFNEVEDKERFDGCLAMECRR
jgi:predicted SAM-dependent methyltransferase